MRARHEHGMSKYNTGVTGKRKPSPTDSMAAANEKKSKVQRRWLPNDVNNVLLYLQSVVKKGKDIEKPTADDFCKKMLQKVVLLDCSVSQLKNKVKNFRKMYQDTIQWRNQTGQGVLEKDGNDSFEKITLCRCPLFKQLDEIFGTKLNINAPFILDTAVLDVEDDDQLVENTSTMQVSLAEVQRIGGETSVAKEHSSKIGKDENLSTPRSSGLKSLSEARNLKASIDDKKIDVEVMKLDFGKVKWEFEKELL